MADYLLRFRDLGGVPRWVFDGQRDHQDLVDKFKRQLPDGSHIRTLLQQTGICSISIGKGSELVTYEVDPGTLQERRWRWISQQVGKWAMDILAADDANAVVSTLFTISKSDDRSAFGAAFESWAHLKLAGGGRFTVREIGSNLCGSVDFSPSSETVFYEKSEEVKSQRTVTFAVIAVERALCSCIRLLFSRSVVRFLNLSVLWSAIQ